MQNNATQKWRIRGGYSKLNIKPKEGLGKGGKKLPSTAFNRWGTWG